MVDLCRLSGLTFACRVAQMMERCDMEILVILEGVDASTSAKLQGGREGTDNEEFTLFFFFFFFF